MQLSLKADYAMRMLIYLGSHPDRIVTTTEISDLYGISRHHLVRVAQTLGESGYVRLQAGRSGGLALNRAPESVRMGDVIEAAEPNMHLAECFDRQTNTCRIAPACGLKSMLREALDSFIAKLNGYTLADILADGRKAKLISIFGTAPAAAAESRVQ